MSTDPLDLYYYRPAQAYGGGEIVGVIPPTSKTGFARIVWDRVPVNAKPNDVGNDLGDPYDYGVSLSRMHAVASDKPTRESLRAEANAKLDAVGLAKRLEVRAELAAAGIKVPRKKMQVASPERRCMENVGTGTEIHQCVRKSVRDGRCGQHAKQHDMQLVAAGSFEEFPNALADETDSLPF